MAGYTKLSSTLVTSTVWRENATTRCVWITMLALADQHGEVQASIPGLADVSRVSIDECEKALAVFLAPDTYSRTQTHEGRRLLPIDGGWFIVNYDKYRDLLSMEHRRSLGRERARRFRERAEVTDSNADVTQSNDKQYAVSSKQKHNAKATTTTALSEKPPRVTWLTPYADAWQATCGGKMPMGPASKALRPLHDQHGAGQVLDHWKAYLAATDPAYASPTRFAATYGRWDGASPTPGVKLGRIEQGRENMASWLADKEAENGATIDCGDDILPGGF